ncbi:MAG: hypothetical protein HZB80_09555 [Deltaproteobacteria bacterium]|nr:hypothetical protein [Deltaproteobacteria bacterium]
MSSFINSHHYVVLVSFFSVILIGNIPVGYYRKRFARFSRPWARCIYIPILVNIVLRRFFGLGYAIVPFTILAILAGQFIGARIKLNHSDTRYDKRDSVSN